VEEEVLPLLAEYNIGVVAPAIGATEAGGPLEYAYLYQVLIIHFFIASFHPQARRNFALSKRGFSRPNSAAILSATNNHVANCFVLLSFGRALCITLAISS
jgi:hypothetical protein